MMRSLYSGISGLKSHQTRMDVIGNNIANVNTVGYKASRVMFQDIYSQTIKSGSAGNESALGGTNPSQIGLGVKLSSVDVVHSNAAPQTTDNAFDMAIDGDGFFVVADYSNVDGTTVTEPDMMYTRVGNFKLDDNGYLVTTDGYYVMGYAMNEVITPVVDSSGNPVNDSDGNQLMRVSYEPDLTGGLVQIQLPANSIGFGVAFNGAVSVTENNVNVSKFQISLAQFSNPSGLEKAGSSMYRETVSSGASQVGSPLSNGAGRVCGGALEMSNVDLASEFTDMIVTQRGYQANSRIITVSDTMLEELVNLKR